MTYGNNEAIDIISKHTHTHAHTDIKSEVTSVVRLAPFSINHTVLIINK